ncbi:winged helix-turn-helix domain-containing protein [Rheinheimera sp.]|uniref:winged helix-turn-helix domain-containing protein n=1 Tax=Rheinheimera sp. TaxID=1869214 RepID=UPI0027B96DEA|nr:crosslink repair DNA glycosylase YcaQ family protein [Rheinheimera sp.]
MDKLPLSPGEFRLLNLQQQGLLRKNKGKAGTLKSIQQLSYVQIDSINVVQRAHHHVLASRVVDYQPVWLDELLAKKQIFEYWSHAAAYLPMADYRFSLYRKQQLLEGKKHWFDVNQQQMREVLARIRSEGPLKAGDFAATTAKNGPWWDWQPAKQALEQLFMQGELMVVRRDKFQKVFDLTERVLPPGLDCRVPDDHEFAAHLVEKYLQSHGFGSVAQICYLRSGIKAAVEQCLLQLVEAGKLTPFNYQNQRYFWQNDLLPPSRAQKQICLLNPFDNLLIQRQRLQHWFDFDYQIEVYVPEAKRKIGYYSLPVLYGRDFIGQLDVKAERKSGVLLLQHLVLLPEVKLTAELALALKQALSDYARFNGCNSVALVKASEPIRLWWQQSGLAADLALLSLPA